VRALFATLAPHAAQPLRTVFANLGALAPLAARVFARLGPELNAMVRTTAVATELSGAPGENVLATTARASINIRLLTGDTVASATARIRRIVADPAVEIEVRHGSDPRRSRPGAASRGGASRPPSTTPSAPTS
jgi:carboxypeptidase PM20D1